MIDLDELLGLPAPVEAAPRPVEPDPAPAAVEPDEDEPAPGQATLFGADEEFHVAWREWRGMPEFVQEDLTPWKSLLVHFETPEDYRAFAELVGQKLSPRTRSIWYPEAEIGHFADKRYADVESEEAGS